MACITGYLLRIFWIYLLRIGLEADWEYFVKGNSASYHHYSRYPIYVYAADQSFRLDGA